MSTMIIGRRRRGRWAVSALAALFVTAGAPAFLADTAAAVRVACVEVNVTGNADGCVAITLDGNATAPAGVAVSANDSATAGTGLAIGSDDSEAGTGLAVATGGDAAVGTGVAIAAGPGEDGTCKGEVLCVASGSNGVTVVTPLGRN
jgi:hypothetical protein